MSPSLPLITDSGGSIGSALDEQRAAPDGPALSQLYVEVACLTAAYPALEGRRGSRSPRAARNLFPGTR